MDIRRVSRRFAIAGVLIGLVWAALYFYDFKFNVFHLPTSDQVQGLNYSEPKSRAILENAMFVMVPGLCLQVFTMDAGKYVAYFMWSVAVVLNAPIYYLMGIGLTALAHRILPLKKARE